MVATAFTRLAGCTAPIQQAPMGPVSPPELAVAVARAGGVGTISAFGLAARDLAARYEEMRASTDGALAVNFITADVDRDALSAAAARFRLVDFFWAEPDPSLVELAHDGGAAVSWQVGSAAEARAAVAAGVDLVCVQGSEAGGHVRGDTALLPLLETVLAEAGVPVLAAGGIAGPRGLAAVLAAGAAGARIGTRFLASTESGAHPDYVAALLTAGPDATEITGGFADCPLCATSPRARVLRSAVAEVAAVEAGGETAVGSMTVGGETVAVPPRFGMPPHRGVRGHVAAMALYAGQSVAAVTEVLDAGRIVRDLTEGAARLLAEAAR